MNISLVLSLILGSLVQSSIAWAKGGDHSGGGTAVVCRNPDHTIWFAQLVDTYEPLEAYGLGHSEFKKPGAGMPRVEKTGDAVKDAELLTAEYDLLLKQKFLKLPINTSLRIMLEQNMAFVRREIEKSYKVVKEQFPGTYMVAQADLGKSRPIRIPYGCQTEFVVFYKGSQSGYRDSLEVNPDIWDALNITDRVALLVHESIYQVRRLFYKDVDSVLSRDLTARLVLLAHDNSEAYTYWDMTADLGQYRRIIPVENYTPVTKVRIQKLDCTGYPVGLSIKLYNHEGKMVGSESFHTTRTGWRGPNLNETFAVHSDREWTTMKVKFTHLHKNCSKIQIEVLNEKDELATQGVIEGETTREVMLYSARVYGEYPVTKPFTVYEWND